MNNLENILFEGKKITNVMSNNNNIQDINDEIYDIKFNELENENVNIENDDDLYLESYKKYKDDFINEEIQIEPILSTENSRYAIYPIQYKTIWDNYKKQLQNNWVIEEVDLSKDKLDWENKLSCNDRKFIMYVLAFFASADGLVNSNLKKNLLDLVKIKEAECAYSKQFEMENAHGEMYSQMLDEFVKDEQLKRKLINSIKTMPTIKKKMLWYKKWIDGDKTFAHKLIASAIVEGIFFSGSFASIFWLKTRPDKIMRGFIKSNKFISRDENLHTDLAYLLYRLLKNKLKESIIYQMVDEAVNIEDEFINESLPCRLLGMNAELMSQYIRYVADRLLVMLDCKKKYDVKNPFEYMKKIDTFVKSNFFEERNDTYSDGKINNPRIFIKLNRC